MVKSFVLIFWGKFRFFFAFILILLSICLFVFYSVKNDELYIPYFHSKFQKTCFNIELPKEYKDKVSFVVNGYETFDYPENKYLLNDSWLPISEEKTLILYLQRIRLPLRILKSKFPMNKTKHKTSLTV